MPLVRLCDADGKSPVPKDAKPCGWGKHARMYCVRGQKAVDAYWNELQAAAAEARSEYQSRRIKAQVKFHKKYPQGKLPDEV